MARERKNGLIHRMELVGAAIFVGQDDDFIYIYDQYDGKKLGISKWPKAVCFHVVITKVKVGEKTKASLSK